MTVTTKTGDDGKSRWMGRVEEKDGDLLEAIGALDELMAVLGVVMGKSDRFGKKIAMINKDLYKISGWLAGYGAGAGLENRIKILEAEIAKGEAKMGLINEFLNAGGELDVWLNWARTVCRRAERWVVRLAKTVEIDGDLVIYLNRLSDWLFVMGRKN